MYRTQRQHLAQGTVVQSEWKRKEWRRKRRRHEQSTHTWYNRPEVFAVARTTQTEHTQEESIRSEHEVMVLYFS